MTMRYATINDLVYSRVGKYPIKEVYHIYYNGQRVSLNQAEYNSEKGAKAAIRYYFKWSYKYHFSNMSEDQYWKEIFSLIEIRKVLY